MNPPITPEQEPTAEWLRCKMHGCAASAVFGGLCLTHKDREQDACNGCGLAFPLDEMHGVITGDGGYNLCQFCYDKTPWQQATAEEIKLYFPELWY